MSPFTGLSAFPITPADAAGRVDVPALRRLVARLAAAGVDSVGLLGTTGSYPYLARDERRRAIDAAMEELGGRVPLLVGVGALRTDAAVAVARDARDAGADAGLLAPVSYTPLLDDEVAAHFEAVASVGLPVCIYNNPGTTHFTFSPALTARLSRVPGIGAVKNPAPEAAHVAADIAGLRAACAPGFRVGYAIDAAMEELGGRVPLLVGVGALRTDAAVALAHDARDAGADAGLLAPVSYTPLLDDEVAAHYGAVAAVGLPLCIYNNPGTTHFTFSQALTARLSRVPGIAAVKNPAPEAAHVAADLAGLRAACAPGFRLGYSFDARATEAMLAGADAWFSVAAGLFPVPCAAIMRAVRAGDAAEARRLNAGLQPLWDLFAARTSLRVVFAAASHLGLCDAAPPLPIQPLGPDARREVAAVIGALGLS